jgi:hypothetical protein
MVSGMEQLRKKQRKALMLKIEAYLGPKLDRMVREEEWTATEIAKEFGVPLNRQCEIKKPGSYANGGLNENILTLAIQGGLLTLTEIKANIQLTKAEQLYLDAKAVNEVAAKIRKLGIDPGAILNEWLKNYIEK